MGKALLRNLLRASSLLTYTSQNLFCSRSVLQTRELILSPSINLSPLNSTNKSWFFRNMSYGTVNLVISQGKPKFETHEVEPSKKKKWLTKKRLKLQRRKEKEKRRAANRKDPRRLNVKGKKKKFASAEERIKDKLEKAKIKEGLLLEKLKRYEVPKVQGPVVEPHELTGEERFYMKKMAQKRSNYVPIGRRGVFAGVILNMHMHWKKHETVKVICKPCKPGQVQEYAEELARLSGGIPIHIIGDDVIIFYRGKNYVQPETMSPIDTLSRKKALEKSKYEQSLESVRRFIAIAEKELELYYRHIALYGDPNDRNPISVLNAPMETFREPKKPEMLGSGDMEDDDEGEELSGEELSDLEDDDLEDNEFSASECEDNLYNFDDKESEVNSMSMGSKSMYEN